MRLLLLGVLLVAGGCTTTVSHPTRSAAQQQADIRQCSRQAERRYQFDAFALTASAFNCLEAKGYRREGTAPAMLQTQRAPPLPRQMRKTPCKVPCRGGT